MKKNIKENIIIFFQLFSLKNNEKNKRKREGKSWGKFYRTHRYYLLFPQTPVPPHHHTSARPKPKLALKP